MRVLVQRVSEARVVVEDQVVGEIGQGLLLFLGIHKDDDEEKIPYLVNKVLHLRIFEDEAGKMNRSLQEVGGKVLVVSQFTLYGDCKTGRRPSFTESMAGETAKSLYQGFVQVARREIGENNVETGRFGSQMKIHLLNDGPVTLLLEQ